MDPHIHGSTHSRLGWWIVSILFAIVSALSLILYDAMEKRVQTVEISAKILSDTQMKMISSVEALLRRVELHDETINDLNLESSKRSAYIPTFERSLVRMDELTDRVRHLESKVEQYPKPAYLPQ